jgi:SAM-dependent methyltransferase
VSGGARARGPTGRATMSSGLHEASNYHAWVFDWLSPYIAGRVLDIGGGTGNHLRHVESRELVCVDIDASVVSELRLGFAERAGWSFVHGDITRPELVEELGRGRFDTVLSSNVFEHIADDAAAFRHAGELLAPGGLLVLLLPAHQRLFGSMDRLAGHERRYDRALVERRFGDAGLAPEVLRYTNLLGAAAWYLNGRWSHRDLSSRSINQQIGLFDRWLVPLARRLERGRRLPCGQSLLAVARKPS